MSDPTSPGWYDDPQDPTLLRYFDGIVWTAHTTPRAGLHAPTAQQSPRASEPTEPPGPTVQAPGAPGPQSPWAQPPRPSQGAGPAYQQPQGYRTPMTHLGPTTPDGVPLATYLQRVGAWVLDGLIKLVISLVLGGWAAYLAVKPQLDAAMRAAERGETVPLDLTGSNTDLHWMAVYLVISGVVGLLYSMFFLTRRGATPGKSAVGISVRLLAHPGALDARTAAVRYLIPFGNAVLAIVPLIGTIVSVLWLVDHLFPLWQPRRQALHDLLAGTVVVVGPQPPRR